MGLSAMGWIIVSCFKISTIVIFSFLILMTVIRFSPETRRETWVVLICSYLSNVLLIESGFYSIERDHIFLRDYTMQKTPRNIVIILFDTKFMLIFTGD